NPLTEIMIIFYGRNSGRIIRDAEDGTDPIAISDIIIIEIGTTIIPCYPGIIVVVLLRKPLLYYLLKIK
ncbi:hypothetical protein KKA24_02460, partial [Patescibacteria group bacterium]|nr:hypothetical protein [Patescibacteria group bacterium]